MLVWTWECGWSLRVGPYIVPALEHAQSTLGPTGNAPVGCSRKQAGVHQKTPLHLLGNTPWVFGSNRSEALIL